MNISGLKNIVGIDLGTTNSVVSIFKDNGDIEFIENKDGSKLIPSFIYVGDDNKFLVGSKARDKMEEDPRRILSSYKRFINTVKPIKKINNKDYDAYTCTSIALKYIKKVTEDYLGEKVDGAVITVPAYFDSNAKAFTSKAAANAGLKVVAILTEPVASAFTYLKSNKVETDSERVLVFDIGGGTFDVSLTNITNTGLANVIGVDGNHYLGGDDFDLAIANLLRKKFLPKVELTDEMKEILVRKAEGLKKDIMSDYDRSKFYEVNLSDSFENVKKGKCGLTVEEYEEVTSMLVDDVIRIVSRLLKEHRFKQSEVDRVILVGGSSRLRNIREALDKFFEYRFNISGEDYEYEVEPDLSVSYGASVYIQMLKQRTTNGFVDVLSKNIGIEDAYGKMMVFLRKNSPLPCKGVKTITNPNDNQDQLTIKIYEGNDEIAEKNHQINRLVVDCPKGLEKGQLNILVRFVVDLNGVLNISFSGDYEDKVTHHVEYLKLDSEKEQNMENELDIEDIEFMSSFEDTLGNSESDSLSWEN